MGGNKLILMQEQRHYTNPLERQNATPTDFREQVKVVQELLKAGDMYQIDELKNICQDTIVKATTVSNVLDMALFADAYNFEDLLQKITNFICKNIQKVMEKHPDWKDKMGASRNIMISTIESMALVKLTRSVWPKLI